MGTIRRYGDEGDAERIRAYLRGLADPCSQSTSQLCQRFKVSWSFAKAVRAEICPEGEADTRRDSLGRQQPATKPSRRQKPFVVAELAARFVEAYRRYCYAHVLGTAADVQRALRIAARDILRRPKK